MFLGFSFFLIAAALILLALLFQFGLEKRATEIGILLAVGWPPRLVRRLFLWEGAGHRHTRRFAGRGGRCSLCDADFVGTRHALAVGRGGLAVALPHHMRKPGHRRGGGDHCQYRLSFASPCGAWPNVLRGNCSNAGTSWKGAPGDAKRKRRWAGWIAGISGAAAIATVGSALFKGGNMDPESFFSGGALLLISGIAATTVLFRVLGSPGASRPLTLTGLGLRGCARRPNRSLATVALLASGSFLIVAVAANKLDATRDSRRRSSGTGGFAFVGQSALPIVQDLNTKPGRDFFGLDENSLKAPKSSRCACMTETTPVASI